MSTEPRTTLEIEYPNPRDRKAELKWQAFVERHQTAQYAGNPLPAPYRALLDAQRTGASMHFVSVEMPVDELRDRIMANVNRA